MGSAKKVKAGPKEGDRSLMSPTQKLAADKKGKFIYIYIPVYIYIDV